MEVLATTKKQKTKRKEKNKDGRRRKRLASRAIQLYAQKKEKDGTQLQKKCLVFEVLIVTVASYRTRVEATVLRERIRQPPTRAPHQVGPLHQRTPSRRAAGAESAARALPRKRKRMKQTAPREDATSGYLTGTRKTRRPRSRRGSGGYKSAGKSGKESARKKERKRKRKKSKKRRRAKRPATDVHVCLIERRRRRRRRRGKRKRKKRRRRRTTPLLGPPGERGGPGDRARNADLQEWLSCRMRWEFFYMKVGEFV